MLTANEQYHRHNSVFLPSSYLLFSGGALTKKETSDRICLKIVNLEEKLEFVEGDTLRILFCLVRKGKSAWLL